MGSIAKLRINPVPIDQSEELLDFAKETFIESFAAVNSKSDMDIYLADKFTNAQMEYELNTEGSEFYSATIDNCWVGYLKVNKGTAQTEKIGDSFLEIERIYVHSKYHGHGVAQELYNKALSLAKESQLDSVWLGVWEENPRAIRFYQKCGFVVFDKHEFKLGNCIQTDLMMQLELR